MKNADRINFYIAGLRQPGPGPADIAALSTQTDTGPDKPVTEGAGEAPSSATARILRDELGLPERLLATDIGQRQEAGQHQRELDQAQLQHLLQRLDHRRLRSGDRFGPSLEATRRRHGWLTLGLVLAVIVIAIQTTALVWLYQRAELLLGRPLTPSLLLTSPVGHLDVTFRPSASAGDIAVLLRELNLQVADGPDAASRYVLRLDIGADSRKTLNTLRDRHDLVYSAEAAD